MRHRKFNPKKHHLPPFKGDGILLVDKPRDWTSHDVVNFVRMRFNVPKIGHCGTLDPAATGLLVLVLGRFTKLSGKFSGEDKTYDATMLLGVETDTQDMEGEVVAENDASGVTEERIRAVCADFIGQQAQVPPMVSAVKKDGKKLYELARKGIEVEREPKEINIERLDITGISPPEVKFTVRCSKGTYIRTLCSDIGAELGCGGVLKELRRTHSGSLNIDNAVTIETLKTWEQAELENKVREFLMNLLAENAGLTEF